MEDLLKYFQNILLTLVNTNKESIAVLLLKKSKMLYIELSNLYAVKNKSSKWIFKIYSILLLVCVLYYIILSL